MKTSGKLTNYSKINECRNHNWLMVRLFSHQNINNCFTCDWTLLLDKHILFHATLSIPNTFLAEFSSRTVNKGFSFQYYSKRIDLSVISLNINFVCEKPNLCCVLLDSSTDGAVQCEVFVGSIATAYCLPEPPSMLNDFLWFLDT